MISEITLIFPDQLFENHPSLASPRPIYLAEEFLFFRVQPFHKQKLVLMRAAMRRYEQELLKKGKKVIYIPSENLRKRSDLFRLLAKEGIKSLHIAEFSDDWLSQDLKAAAKRYKWEIHFSPSPGFLSSPKELNMFFGDKEHYSMAQFYTYQRKKLNILMEGSKPFGGKYSFDAENRKKIPNGIKIPKRILPSNKCEKIVSEINNEFRDAYGEATPFLYPTTHREARKALQKFLHESLAYFGDYQDAILMDNSVLFHSVLSPLLNIGLLTPDEVVKETLTYAKTHAISINSLEGFLRQIIGWREFVRASYLLKGSIQRTMNFFNHHEKIPKSFWQGTTGLLPIDITVKKTLKTGYCNHIERLMVLGNFLLLTETSPNEVYRWFMANFVDAYDWVMVPNVYGMTQYSDGGIIVTKPYISGSNYLLKMSNYPKGEWTEIWDGLFWRFLNIHRHTLSSNPRIGLFVNSYDKNKLSLRGKIQKAENWLSHYRKK